MDKDDYFDAEGAEITTIPAGDPHTIAYDQSPLDRHALLARGDSALVLIGSKADLVDFLRRALDAADALPDVDPDDPGLRDHIAGWHTAHAYDEHRPAAHAPVFPPAWHGVALPDIPSENR